MVGHDRIGQQDRDMENDIRWNPAEHHDEYQSALMAYIDEKVAKGATEVVKGGEKERDSGGIPTNTIDLAAYLEKSIMSGKRAKS